MYLDESTIPSDAILLDIAQRMASVFQENDWKWSECGVPSAHAIFDKLKEYCADIDADEMRAIRCGRIRVEICEATGWRFELDMS